MRTCPDHDELAALIDREVTEARAEALREHAEECGRCREELGSFDALARRLRTPVPGALGRSAEAFADDVMAMIDQPRPVTAPARRQPRWVVLAAAAVIPLLVGAAALHRTSASDGEWTARGGSAPSAVERTLFRFGRVEAGAFDPITSGMRIGTHDVLAAEVGATESGPRFLLAFLLDATGERHWIYPAYEVGAPPPASVTLPATASPRVLSSMVRLDDPAPGPATLVAVVLGRAESVEFVEGAAREELGRERLQAHYGDALVVTVPVLVEAR